MIIFRVNVHYNDINDKIRQCDECHFTTKEKADNYVNKAIEDWKKKFRGATVEDRILGKNNTDRRTYIHLHGDREYYLYEIEPIEVV